MEVGSRDKKQDDKSTAGFYGYQARGAASGAADVQLFLSGHYLLLDTQAHQERPVHRVL
jgi:hypothetical protein